MLEGDIVQNDTCSLKDIARVSFLGQVHLVGIVHMAHTNVNDQNPEEKQNKARLNAAVRGRIF